MTKHTPGPWRTKREGFSTVYVEARIDGGLIQEVAACGPTEAGRDQQEANARLICEAPGMLKLLQELQQSASYWSEYDVPLGIVDRINTAIARATGETAC